VSNPVLTITMPPNIASNVQNWAKVMQEPRSLNAAMGKRVEIELRGHFRRRNAEPNKRGWPKKNFWNRIAKSTALTEATDRDATVTISDPAFGMKLRGGVIKAKRARNLAIPLTAEASVAGSPGEGGIEGLFAIKPEGARAAFLARQTGTTLEFLYLLVPKVNMPRDPEALPPDGALQAAASDEANKWIARRGGRS
jgi:hypothetical protein